MISKANYNCRKNRRILHRHILPAPIAGYFCEVYLTSTATMRYGELFCKKVSAGARFWRVSAREDLKVMSVRIVSRLTGPIFLIARFPHPRLRMMFVCYPLPSRVREIHRACKCLWSCARSGHEIQRIPSVRLTWVSFRAFAHFLNKVRRRLQNLSTASQQAASITFCA